MAVDMTWSSPTAAQGSGGIALVTGDTLTQTSWQKTVSNIYLLGGTDGLISLGSGDMWNVGLSASVASNILTIALKGKDGNDPSATNPVRIAFRNATLTTGTPSVGTITSAISLSIPNTATLGTTNSVNYRIWIGIMDVGGTSYELFVMNTQGTSTTHSLPSESALHSFTAVSNGADSAGVMYDTNGRSSRAVRILGYIEITEGTAGTWATAPTVVQVMGPGVRRTNDILQIVQATYATQATNDTSTPADSRLTASITPSSTANRVIVFASQQGITKATNIGQVDITLLRGATQLADARACGDTTGGSDGVSFAYLDAPASTSSVTYKTQFASVDNNAQARVQEGGNSTSIMLLQEMFV